LVSLLLNRLNENSHNFENLECLSDEWEGITPFNSKF